MLGAVAGNVLPAVVTTAVGVAIYGMLIAIVVPPMRDHRPTAICVLIAIALSCAFYYLPLLSAVSNGFVIIICSVTASALLALLHPISEETED